MTDTDTGLYTIGFVREGEGVAFWSDTAASVPAVGWTVTFEAIYAPCRAGRYTDETLASAKALGRERFVVIAVECGFTMYDSPTGPRWSREAVVTVRAMPA